MPKRTGWMGVCMNSWDRGVIPLRLLRLLEILWCWKAVIRNETLIEIQLMGCLACCWQADIDGPGLKFRSFPIYCQRCHTHTLIKSPLVDDITSTFKEMHFGLKAKIGNQLYVTIISIKLRVVDNNTSTHTWKSSCEKHSIETYSTFSSLSHLSNAKTPHEN